MHGRIIFTHSRPSERALSRRRHLCLFPCCDLFVPFSIFTVVQMKSWGCGEVGWLKRNTVNMKVVSIWFSWNHDYNKRWEDFPKSCQFTEPAGTFYSGNRHTQAASTVGIYAWFISTVAITQACSPHGTSYLTSVKNWSNYVCLKCSHFKTSFPVMRRRQLWLISDHRCRTPTVCLPSEPAAIWHLRCFFFNSKSKNINF